MDKNLSVPKNTSSQELTGLEKVAFFQDKKIRKIWHEEEWWFSVVDIVGALTDSIDAKDYWYRLKIREKDSTGLELSTFCRQLKLESNDGKKYETDCVNTESAFRIIQSIPSKKAEPFKLWLAKVGKERIDETYDPELTINRAMHTYLQKGYSKEWINQRLKTIEVRKELTDEWNRTGIEKQSDYAILTNELTKAWAGKTVKEYKEFKNLKKESLRDNMSNLELVLNMLAEATTTEISKSEDPKTFVHSKKIAKDGGAIAGKTRKNIEKKIGKSVIRKENNLDLKEKKQLK